MDKIIKSICFDNMVRLYAIDATELTEELRRRHDLHPTSLAALGRTTAATLLMASLYEDNVEVDVNIDGDGPIGKINCSATSSGYCYAYLDNPHVYIRRADGHLDVGKAVGKGFLNVTKDLHLKEKFTSSSPLVSGEIAEDFTYYFASSEQVPTSIGLAVLVNPDGTTKKCYGYLLQLMPFTTDEVINRVESLIMNMDPIAKYIEEGKEIIDIIDYLSDNKCMIIGEQEVKFFCPCTKEHFARSLSVLKKEDLEDLAKDPITTVRCHRCGETYEFTSDEIKQILKERE